MEGWMEEGKERGREGQRDQEMEKFKFFSVRARLGIKVCLFYLVIKLKVIFLLEKLNFMEGSRLLLKCNELKEKSKYM